MRRNGAWRLLSVIAVLALLSTLGGCGRPAGWKGIIKVGTVLPFHGYDGGAGYNVLFAVKQAIAEWNQRGGAGGYRVELIALDDGNDAATAARRAKELAVDPAIIGVVGYLSSDSALAAVDEYHRAGLAALVLSPLVGEVPPETFGLGGTVEEVARSAVAWLGAKRVAVVSGKTSAQMAAANAFATAVEQQGGVVLLQAKVEATRREFAPLADEIEGSGAQLAFFSGGYEQAAGLYRELRSSGVAFLADGGSDTPDFLRVGGGEGAMYIAVSPPLTASQEAAEFSDSYRRMRGMEPRGYAARAYDAVSILLEAVSRLSQAGRPITRAGVVAELRQIGQYAGVTGPIGLTGKGPFPVAIYRIEKDGYPGELVHLGP